MEQEILSIIPARGGSKGISRKNITDLHDKPLTAYSIEQSLSSELINRTIVSTDDEEIARIAEKYEAEIPFMRPKRLAKNETPSLPVFQHALEYLGKEEGYYPDIVVALQPTSPLRNQEDLRKCIQKLVKMECDTVITVREVEHPPHWIVKVKEDGKVEKFFKELDDLTRRQEAKDLYMPNGAIFATWPEILLQENRIRGEDTRAVIMPPERSVDIDTKIDLLLAEKLLEEGYV